MAKKELDLADILADSLNKQAKDQKVAFFLDSDEFPQQMLKVGFRQEPYVGCCNIQSTIWWFTVGRITEITGLEQSGKSLLKNHLLG